MGARPGRSHQPPRAPVANTYVAPGRSVSGHQLPCSRAEYVSSLSSGPSGVVATEDMPPYPTIRRVHPACAPSSMIRSVPILPGQSPQMRSPPLPTTLYQYKPYQSSQARRDYHVTQLQPYFENGRVHYRTAPTPSSASSYYSPDGALCDVDATAPGAAVPLHRLPGRDLAFLGPAAARQECVRVRRGAAPRPAQRGQLLPGHRPQHGPHAPGVADAKHAYASVDLEDLEKYRLQSIRRRAVRGRRPRGPRSQYDNMSPSAPPRMTWAASMSSTCAASLILGKLTRWPRARRGGTRPRP